MSIPHQTTDVPPDDWGTDRTDTDRSFGGRMPPGSLPQDQDAEQAILGSMLLSKDTIEAVAAGARLKGRDFYRPVHETIYETIIGLYAKDEPADPITTAAELFKRGQLERVGGAPYLHTLVQSVPTAANAEYYAEIVKENAGKRRLVEAGVKITQLGYAEQDLSVLRDEASAALFQVSDDVAEEDFGLAGDSLEDDLDALEAIGNGEVTGIATGFTDLDALTTGLQPEQFIIVAGRPTMGKSTLGLDFVRECAIKNNIPAAFFSLEMGRREINYRLLSAMGKIPLHHMRSGTMTEEDWTRLARIQPRFKEAPVYLDTSTSLTMMDIRTKARRLVDRYGVKLVVIDYIQLMQTGSKKSGETRQQDVSDISRGLKLLSKELHVPVVGLSQLNRGPENRTDKKPMVSDLRESGSLEQDADMVILVHREDAYEKESPRSGEADLIVGKHRNGPTATITVAFQGHYARFTDMAQT